jgi:hypothetical protein
VKITLLLLLLLLLLLVVLVFVVTTLPYSLLTSAFFHLPLTRHLTATPHTARLLTDCSNNSTQFMIGTQQNAASLSFIRYNIAKQRKDI